MERASRSVDEVSTSFNVSSSPVTPVSPVTPAIPSTLTAITRAPRPALRQSCSKLESLPPELLEKIFFHSLEINLPRASWHIALVLSKPIIYKWLVRLAFSSTNLGSKRDFFTPDFLPPPLNFWALSTAERLHLQTVILECRWCTLELLRQCQRDYVKHVIRQKCKDIVFCKSDQHVLDNIDQWLSHPMDFDLALHGRRGSGDLVLRAKQRNPTNASTSNSTSTSTTANATPSSTLSRSQSPIFSDVKMTFWIHFAAIQIREPIAIAHEIDVFRLPCPPSPDERPRMPDKLLREPWTPEKLELLILLSQEAWIDEDQGSIDRSLLVMRRLIRNRDYATFEKLLHMYVVTRNYSYPQPWPVKTRHFRAALKHATGKNDPFVRLLYEYRWNVLPERERDVKVQVLNNLDIPSRWHFD